MKGVRKALRRRGVEVYDVNEDYTSQLCNCCHNKVVPMYSEGSRYAIHSVRRCLTPTCMRKTLKVMMMVMMMVIHTTMYDSVIMSVSVSTYVLFIASSFLWGKT